MRHYAAAYVDAFTDVKRQAFALAVKHIDARPFGQRRRAGAQVLRVLVNVDFRLEAVWHHGGGVILLMNEYWFFSQYSVPHSRLHTRRIITHRDL